MPDATENKEPTGAQRLFGDFAPALVGYTDDVLFGDVWKH
jgi:4-carboxymuconolactone decarboxylase